MLLDDKFKFLLNQPFISRNLIQSITSHNNRCILDELSHSLVLAGVSDLLKDGPWSVTIDNELVHFVVKQFARVPDIDSCFHFVTSEHPYLDPGIFHKLDGVAHSVL
jgi:hypothetical protein